MERIPAATARGEPVADFPPLQLEMRVPFLPTAIPSAGREHLIYELHLRNFGNGPLPLSGLEILDANSKAAVAGFEGASAGSADQPDRSLRADGRLPGLAQRQQRRPAAVHLPLRFAQAFRRDDVHAVD